MRESSPTVGRHVRDKQSGHRRGRNDNWHAGGDRAMFGPYDLLNGLERFQPILTNLDDNSCILTNDDAHCVLGGRTQHLRYFWKCKAVASHQPLDHVRCCFAKGVVQRRAKAQGYQVSCGFDAWA